MQFVSRGWNFKVTEQRWNADEARHTWAVPHWSEGYFDVGDNGDLLVRPRRNDGPTLSLPATIVMNSAAVSRIYPDDSFG